MNIVLNPYSVSGIATAPPSKSYTIRALVAALFANGQSEIYNASFCADVLAAIDVVSAFGADVSITENNIRISSNGIHLQNNSINCGESGLLARLSVCIAAQLTSPITINASGSMLARPSLVPEKVLNELGIATNHFTGKFPLSIQGPMIGGNIRIYGSRSSQFISGLLMTLPIAHNDSTLIIENLVSTPYLQMTIDTIEKFGVKVCGNATNGFTIKGNQNYLPCNYNVEGDWSGASFLLVAGALNGEIKVDGLNLKSLQADRRITEALIMAGSIVHESGNSISVKKDKLNAFEFDATNCPDLIPPLVVLASACEGTSKIKGINRLIFKESNRAKTLIEVFSKLGVTILANDDSFHITASKTPENIVTIDPSNDHRIAMAAAIRATCLNTPIKIENTECVDKSFPGFFTQLKKLMQ